MWGYVVLMLWFMVGRLTAVVVFAMAVTVRCLGATNRVALQGFLFGVVGLAPAAVFYAHSDDPWQAMSDAVSGPWLDVADAVMLIAAAVTLLALRRRPPA